LVLRWVIGSPSISDILNANTEEVLNVVEPLDIVIWPNPTLNEVCKPCKVGDPGLRNIAERMAVTMYENEGVGLAAPQVGFDKRLIVVDCQYFESGEADPIFLVNPEVIETGDDAVRDQEGCLSFPGISVPITRPSFARVKYYDIEGNECFIEGDGLLGRCLQHEIDHLDGKTVFTNAAPMDRITAMREYQIAQQMGAKPGSTSV